MHISEKKKLVMFCIIIGTSFSQNSELMDVYIITSD